MERVSSAVRLELRPGEWVLWKARPFRFVSLHGGVASIRDSVNANLHEVAVADLRGMPSLPPEDFDRRVDRLVDIEDPAVRGSALWFAHSAMASFHQDASDRQTAYRHTSRQAIKYATSPPWGACLARLPDEQLAGALPQQMLVNPQP